MLAGEIKAAAEAFFEVELADVELHFGSLAGMDAEGFTLGNHVYLNAETLVPWSRRSLEVLGHELTHVIQQRQGRVKANLLMNGMPANADEELEREAMEMGRRFASGRRSTLPRLPARPPGASVV